MNWPRHKPQQRAATELLEFHEPATGRMLAWAALQEHDETDRFLADILAEWDQRNPLPTQDRAQAVDLTANVLRRRRTIDVLLQSQISRPRESVEPDLWRLLQLGVCQILFAKTPDHAAVDSTVQLARTAGRPRWTGFANGVLRNVLRLVDSDSLSQSQVAAQNRIPTSDGGYLTLQKPVFADPLTAPNEYFGQAFSLPESLAKRWAGRYSRTELEQAGFHGLQVPMTTLRVNRLRATTEQVRVALEEAGLSCTHGDNPWALRLEKATRLTSLPGFKEGWWSVQDESAMAAAALIDPKPGERILDLCAAPGGKSTHMAELSGDQATIEACDVSEHRLERIHQSVERLQVTSVHPILIQRDGTDIPDEPYDAVLVDVPCSNTGVLSRRPEARWRFREDELTELTTLQMRLLMTAVDHVRPGGRIVYSTCSIEPEETKELISSAVAAAPSLNLVREHIQLPGQPADGAYQALLAREI